MTVTAITSLEHFNQVIASDKTVVIDFWATWCGPCKMISPVFEKLSESVTALDFYKVDIDEQEEVAAKVGIKAMPTFLFFKNGEESGKVLGADPNKLKAAIELQAEA